MKNSEEPEKDRGAAGRQQTEDKLKQRNRELELLNQFTSEMIRTLELPKIVQSLQNSLVEKLEIPGIATFLFNKPREELQLEGHVGLPSDVVERVQSWPVSRSSVQRVLLENESLYYPDFREVDLFLELQLDVLRPEWQSFLCVPLMAEGESEGILCLFSQAPTKFSDRQITFFKTLGRSVGTAVQNARLFEEVSQGRERLRRIAQRVFSTQEKERQRVSRELHDEAGQALTGLKIHLEMIESELSRLKTTTNETAVDSLRDQVQTAVNLCESTMGQIRLLAHGLRPAALENLGLDTTLKGFCRSFAQRTQLAIAYEGADPPELPDAVEICLYRFLQESLTNVVKHAQAESVEVKLQVDANTISLSVMDDGQGFDSHHSDNTFGIGLSGMRERIEAVSGRLLVESNPGEGSCLIAWIPL